MSSRVRQDEPPGRSRQRQIANLNKTTSPNFRLNFRLAFLSFVYFGKQPFFLGGGTDGAAPRTPGAASGLERILSICSWRSSAKCCPIGSSITSTPSARPRALLRANAPPTTLVRSKTSFGAHQSNKWCAPFSPVMRMTAQGGGLGRAGFRHRIYRESDSGKVLWA